MARIARVVVEGVPHHVTQRGNGRQQVFHTVEDYALYRRLLGEYAERFGLAIWAYCLMPNHAHLVCVPEAPKSLARAVGHAHADFARNFNIRRQICGHVWQARFFSCALGRPHLWRAMAYVERNPVRAGLAEYAWDYPWSSAAVHCGLEAADPLIQRCTGWEAEYGWPRWREVLLSSIAEEAVAQRIREATRCGWPLGDTGFVQELESTAGRRLHPLPPGRPKAQNDLDPGAAADQLSLGIGV